MKKKMLLILFLILAQLGMVAASPGRPIAERLSFRSPGPFVLTMNWTETDTASRNLNFKVNGADRTLTVDADGTASQWNTAYGWGNHSGLYTPIAHKTTEDAISGLVKVNGLGGYSGVTDNSANWNTAYGWGNHAGLYLPIGGGTLTGGLSWTGTTFPGLRLNNLTAAQVTAIGSPLAGHVVWDTDVARMRVYNGSAWTDGFVRLAGDTMTGDLVLGSTTAGKSLTVNATLGTELITAPMVTGGWTLGYDTGGWAISAGVLSKTASTGTQTATAVSGMTSAPTAGTTYRVTIVCSAVSGTLTYTLGGVIGTSIGATTTTDYITAASTAKIIFSGGASVTATITSVSVMAVSGGAASIGGTLAVNGVITSPGGIVLSRSSGYGFFPKTDTSNEILLRQYNSSTQGNLYLSNLYASASVQRWNGWTLNGPAHNELQLNPWDGAGYAFTLTLGGAPSDASALTHLIRGGASTGANKNGSILQISGGAPGSGGAHGNLVLQPSGGSVQIGALSGVLKATAGVVSGGATASDISAEPAAGNPAADGYVLSSTTAGVRSWVAQSGGGGGTSYAVLGSASGIDAKATGNTLIYTVPAGKSLIPAFVQIRITALTGGSGAGPVAALGGNSTSYDDILGGQYIPTSTNNTTRIMKIRDSFVPVYGAGSTIYLRISAGSDATTETWTVYLIGFLI